MTDLSPSARARILEAAREILAADSGATVADIAGRAGVSRATVHRYFPTRAGLLASVGQEPDRGTRERILAAAADLVGHHGFSQLSMDELAAAAGVSRASVYRLFPGKAALYEALVFAYSPFSPMTEYVTQARDLPPEVVVPELYRLLERVAAPNVGLLSAMLVEVASASPDVVAGAERPVNEMLAVLRGYLERQMDAGRVVRMNPLLAVQALLGPIVFHLLTRPTASRIVDPGLLLGSSVEQLSVAALRGLTPPSGGIS
jgi:AcrR family transcriptional regulator